MPAERPQKTHPHNDTSPWTLAYEMHCQQEEQSDSTSMSSAMEEQQPTHDALVDVYNREFPTASDKRVSFSQ